MHVINEGHGSRFLPACDKVSAASYLYTKKAISENFRISEGLPMKNAEFQELKDDELNLVIGGAASERQKAGKVHCLGIPAEGNTGKGFIFACQNTACGKAFIITDLNADEYECPYCHKVHVSCG